MIQDAFPSEKEQQATYREQLEAFHPLPVTNAQPGYWPVTRRFDSNFPDPRKTTFLGWRGIRVTLDHRKSFW